LNTFEVMYYGNRLHGKLEFKSDGVKLESS
jgi:hypothetical protein